MNVGRTYARCRECKSKVDIDRQAEQIPDQMDGTAATLLTNRYWVEKEDRLQEPDAGTVEILGKGPLPRGAVIAIAELVGCALVPPEVPAVMLFPGQYMAIVNEQEMVFGDYTPGPTPGYWPTLGV